MESDLTELIVNVEDVPDVKIIKEHLWLDFNTCSKSVSVY